MSTPIVAIVGRPNVGKSTLFNRLVGRKEAIVHDAPGVTRDRHYADAHVRGRELTVIDTGGFDPGDEDPFARGIATQVEIAIAEADVVLCVLDATSPPTDADRHAVDLLRRSGVRAVYVANKADNESADHQAADLYRLGVDSLIPASALHGRGTARIEAAIVDALPPSAPATSASQAGATPLALIGRPNAGKSTLFNRLAGSERSLVTDRPGTTRDPVDVDIRHGDRTWLLVDTAGIRKKARITEDVEAVSVVRAIRAAGRAEVVVLVCDATVGVRDQEQRLFGLCADRGRAVVVGLNKSDQLDRTALTAAKEQASDALRFARWAPIVPFSARTGRGVDALMGAAGRASDEFHRRVATAELNRFFEQVVERHPPPTHGGRAPRLYYFTQAETSPPVFIAVTNAPDHVKASYQRFLENQIRERFGFAAVPLRIRFRAKSRRRGPAA